MPIDFLTIASALEQDLFETLRPEDTDAFEQLDTSAFSQEISRFVGSLKEFPKEFPKELTEEKLNSLYFYFDPQGFPVGVKIITEEVRGRKQYKIQILDSDGATYESEKGIREVKEITKKVKDLHFEQYGDMEGLRSSEDVLMLAFEESFTAEEKRTMKEKTKRGSDFLIKTVLEKEHFFKQFKLHQFGDLGKSEDEDSKFAKFNITKRNGFIYFSYNDSEQYIKIDLLKSKKTESDIIGILLFSAIINENIFDDEKKFLGLFKDIHIERKYDPFFVFKQKDSKVSFPLRKSLYSFAFNHVIKNKKPEETILFVYELRKKAINKFLDSVQDQINPFQKAKLNIALLFLSDIFLTHRHFFNMAEEKRSLSEINRKINRLAVFETPAQAQAEFFHQINTDKLPKVKSINVPKKMQKPPFRISIDFSDISTLNPYAADYNTHYFSCGKGSSYIDFFSLKSMILSKMNVDNLESDNIEKMIVALSKLLSDYSDYGFKIPNQQAQFLTICLHHMRIKALINLDLKSDAVKDRLKLSILSESKKAIKASIQCFLDERYNSFMNESEREIVNNLWKQYSSSDAFSYDGSIEAMKRSIEQARAEDNFNFEKTLQKYMIHSHKENASALAKDGDAIEKYQRAFYVRDKLPEALKNCISEFNLFCSVPQQKAYFGKKKRFMPVDSLKTDWRQPNTLQLESDFFNEGYQIPEENSLFSEFECTDPGTDEDLDPMELYDTLCLDFNMRAAGEENVAFLRSPEKSFLEKAGKASLPILRNLRVIANQADGKIRFISILDYIQKNPSILANEVAKPAILNALFYNQDVLCWDSGDNAKLHNQLSGILRKLNERTRPGEYNSASGFLKMLCVLSNVTIIDKPSYEKEFFGEFLSYVESLKHRKDLFIEENKKNPKFVPPQYGENLSLDQKMLLSSEYKNATDMAIAGMILAKKEKDDVLFICCHEIFLRCRNQCTGKDDAFFEFNADLQKYFYERNFDFNISKEQAEKLQMVFGPFFSGDDTVSKIKKEADSESISSTTMGGNQVNLFAFTRQIEKNGKSQDIDIDYRSIAKFLKEPFKSYYLSFSDKNSFLIKIDSDAEDKFFVMILHGQEYKIYQNFKKNLFRISEADPLFIESWSAQTDIDGKPFYLFNLEKEYQDFDFELPEHIKAQYDCWVSLDNQKIIFSEKKAPIEKVYEYTVSKKCWETSAGEKVIELTRDEDLLRIKEIFGPGVAIETSPGTYDIILNNTPNKKMVFYRANKTIRYENIVYSLEKHEKPFPHLLSCDGQKSLTANRNEIFCYQMIDDNFNSYEAASNLFYAFSCADSFLYKECLKAISDLSKITATYLEINEGNEKFLLQIISDWDNSVERFKNPFSVVLFLKALAAFSVNKEIPEMVVIYIKNHFALYNQIEGQMPIEYQLSDFEYNVLNQHCPELNFSNKKKSAHEIKIEISENIKARAMENAVGLFIQKLPDILKNIIPVSLNERKEKPKTVDESRGKERDEDKISFEKQVKEKENLQKFLYDAFFGEKSSTTSADLIYEIKEKIEKIKQTQEKYNKETNAEDDFMFFESLRQGDEIGSLVERFLFSTEKIKKIQEVLDPGFYEKLSNKAIHNITTDFIIKSLDSLVDVLGTASDAKNEIEKNNFLDGLIRVLSQDIQYNLSQAEAICSAFRLEVTREIRIRKEQNEIVDQIVKHYEISDKETEINRHLSVRAPMGGGKTTFIFPLVMKRLGEKDPSKLNVAIVPKQTYEMNKTTLTKVSNDLGQGVIPFQFSRYKKKFDFITHDEVFTEWTLQDFREKLETLKLAKDSRAYIITTKDSLLSLKNKWRELLYSEDSVSEKTREKIKVLEEILGELKKSNFVADELDSLLDPKTELIYPITQKESFDEECIFDVLQLHQIMDFNFKSQLTKEEFVQKIIEFSTEHFSLSKEEIDSFLKTGKELSDKRLMKKMLIWKGLFEQRIPFTNTLNLLKDFGLSKENADDYTAIPYKLGEPKEGSKFADPYLTAILTADLWHKEGISREIFKKIFDEFKDKIKESQKVMPGNGIESLKPYKDFQEVFGRPFPFNPLAGSDDEGKLKEAFWASVYRNKKFIHYALCRYILPTISLNSVMVKSTSNDLMEMCENFSGFTGTLYSEFLYNSETTLQIKGFDTKIEDTLSGQTPSFVDFLSQETNMQTYLAAVFSEKIDEYSVFLDIGGHFSDLRLGGDYRISKNLRVASEMLDFLEKSKSKKRYVGYFDDNGALCFIDRSLENPKIFEPFTDISIPIAEYLDCAPDDFMIIIDQARCIGTDLKLPPKARAIGTVASHFAKDGRLLSGTRWDEFAQGLLRMRQFSKGGQQIDLICDKSLKTLGHVHDMQTLIDFTHQNLNKTLVENNETHALQVINSCIQGLSEAFILDPNIAIEERALRETSVKLILQEIQSQDPHLLFQEKSATKPVHEILIDYINDSFKRLQEIGLDQDVLATNKEKLCTYVQFYQNLLSEKRAVSDGGQKSALGATVECQQQAQQQAQQQQELAYEAVEIPENPVPFMFKPLPSAPLTGEENVEDEYFISSLNSYTQSTFFSKNLYISCNLSQTGFSDTVLSDSTKDAHFAVHFFESNGNHQRTVLLTLEEVATLKANPKPNWGAYMVTTVLDAKTVVIASNDLDSLVTPIVPDDISEQLLVYVVAISELYEMAKANTLRTLVNKSSDEKLALVTFLEENSKKVYQMPAGKLAYVVEKINPDRLTTDPGLLLTKDITHNNTEPEPEPEPESEPEPKGEAEAVLSDGSSEGSKGICFLDEEDPACPDQFYSDSSNILKNKSVPTSFSIPMLMLSITIIVPVALIIYWAVKKIAFGINPNSVKNPGTFIEFFSWVYYQKPDVPSLATGEMDVVRIDGSILGEKRGITPDLDNKKKKDVKNPSLELINKELMGLEDGVDHPKNKN